MTVYLLTKRGVLHIGNELHGEVQSFEGDNLDSAALAEVIQNEMDARRAAKRLCRRCFPGDRLRK